MQLSDKSIESLKALRHLLSTSFKGASLGAFHVDEATAAIDEALFLANRRDSNGYVRVPLEPTEAMIDAAFGATVWPDLSKGTPLEQEAIRRNMRKEWRAMVLAALPEGEK